MNFDTVETDPLVLVGFFLLLLNSLVFFVAPRCSLKLLKFAASRLTLVHAFYLNLNVSDQMPGVFSVFILAGALRILEVRLVRANVVAVRLA